jgi:hypothetical protein
VSNRDKKAGASQTSKKKMKNFLKSILSNPSKIRKQRKERTNSNNKLESMSKHHRMRKMSKQTKMRKGIKTKDCFQIP